MVIDAGGAPAPMAHLFRVVLAMCLICTTGHHSEGSRRMWLWCPTVGSEGLSLVV